MAKTTGMEHVSVSEMGKSGVDISRSIRLTSGRFAVLQKGKQFALVPWQQAVQIAKGNVIEFGVRKGISR